ncbi:MULTISPECIES: oxygen-dependent tRNA uridine(34) hydroxylase TrhO [Arthrobacter]|uniref:oxygen-dependent tRNA uridine(34) hydroxylase TrhO n=1 Tax=unclassified Arthrobacter TaxID=235627 RepID=UPI0024BA9D98|nr:rhodanese-related sulfurtransferase [Arthrobacter sp. H35-MC1]MDJ0317869.1 rhodanese-related sulfurtransferase [Arthrobacter sp. H35-MC1]
MSMNKIVLFYGFTPLSDPTAIRLWQRALGEKLHLKGRIIISKDGINATVGGDIRDLKQYLKATREYPGFKDMDIKWSDGMGDDFPRLSVKVREEIVSFGAPGELKVDQNGVVGGGTHLQPEELHELVAAKEANGDEVVFFDGRNAFEAQIGKFKDAIVPDVATTADFIKELDSGKYDGLKDKPVVTYCTGGIRCEVLSSLMINRGFKEVYQMDGGIVRYGETFKDKGLWEGSLYVFDKRMHLEFSDEALEIGHCIRCNKPSNKFENCSNPSCRNLNLYCADCASTPETLLCPQGCTD